MDGLTTGLKNFYHLSGIYNISSGNVIMIIIGLLFLYLAIKKDYEPLLLVPIGFGIIIGNIPYLSVQAAQIASENGQLVTGLSLGVYDGPPNLPISKASVFWYLYQGVTRGIYPPLIFLGIGAMTDFSALLSNPKLLLLGAAAQVGIFITLLGSIGLGFSMKEAGAIGIIGGADGPTAIFLSSQIAPHLLGAIAIAAYSYMALVPVIQPPIMTLLTSREERLIRMKPSRRVTKVEKIIFPIVGLLVCCFIAPGALSLLGMLFFGNVLKESGVTDRLAKTAGNALIDTVTIVLGLTVGASTQASTFLTANSIKIFIMGAFSFAIATAGGVLFAKLMNLFLKDKINPLIGAAGVSAVPDSARVVHTVGMKEDPSNFLLMHAMGPNVAGVIGSAIAAGVLWSVLV
jgi:oxaloacetate decarboxylase beta subunit